MGKLTTKSKLAMAVSMACFAGSAFAANGDLTLGAGNDTIGLAHEKIAMYSPSEAPNALSFTLGTNYVNNDTVAITLSGTGEWVGSNFFMVTDCDGSDDANGVAQTCFGKNPFTLISISADKKTITFRVTDDTAVVDADDDNSNDQSAVAAGRVYYITNASTIAGNTPAIGENPAVKVHTMTAGSTITATVASKTSTGLDLDNVTGTKTRTLFRDNYEFSASINGATDFGAIIDVASDRKTFTGAATTDTMVLNLRADASSLITDAEQHAIAGNDTVVVTIKGDFNGVSGVSDGTNAYTINAAKTQATRTYTAAQITALNGAAAFGDGDNESLNITLTATVDGTTALDARTFTADVSTNLDDAVVLSSNGDRALLTDAAAGSWTINAVVRKVYFFNPASNANQVSLLRVTNASTAAGDVTIDAINEDGTVVASNVKFNLAAGKSVQLSAADLENGNVSKGFATGMGTATQKRRLTITGNMGKMQVQNLVRNNSLDGGIITDVSNTTLAQDFQDESDND